MGLAEPAGPAARDAPPAACADPAVELVGIDKRFGPVHANRNVDLRIPRGTIHGIVGENGAGKSTLMNILYGYYQADRGAIRVDGQECRIHSPEDAIRAGIGMVHQHFMLVEPFTVRSPKVPGARARTSPIWSGNTASRSSSMPRSPICRSACSSGSRS